MISPSSTAVAEIFIAHLSKTATEVETLQERLVSQTQALLMEERSDLLSLSNRLVHYSSLFRPYLDTLFLVIS